MYIPNLLFIGYFVFQLLFTNFLMGKDKQTEGILKVVQKWNQNYSKVVL